MSELIIFFAELLRQTFRHNLFLYLIQSYLYIRVFIKIFYATKINRLVIMFYPSKKIVVGSRESPLAKKQVEIFLKALKVKFGESSLKFIEKNFSKLQEINF